MFSYNLWTESEDTPRISGMQEAQKKLGKRIRELREKEGFSQEAFADACGLNRVHMSDIERGQVNLSIATLKKIADNLDTTAAGLLKGIL